ncbi:MAG: hypothetical protein EZS28_019579, partial [Streblomastix strix]
MRLSNGTMGPVKQKSTKNSRMDDRDSPNFSQLSRDGPDKEPRTQSSSSNEGAPAIVPIPTKDSIPESRTGTQLSLSRNYETFTRIEDDFMEEKGCEVYVGEQTGEVQVRFRGQVKAVVKEQGLFGTHNNERQDAQYWEFQSEEELRLWVACILADAALVKNERLQTTIRASQAKVRTFRDTEPDHAIPTELQQMRPVKRKREDEERIIQASNPLQAQFQQQRLQYAKFNSIEDQMVAQDLSSTFEGILRQEAGKLDVLNYQMQPVARQKLFDEITWSGANTIFPMPEAPPALPEEGPGYARMTLEATSAVTQGLAGIIHQIAGGDTQEVVGKLFKVFKASLLSVGDAQRERESRIRGFQSGATAEDILSRQSKEKFKKSAKTVQIGQRRFGYQFGNNQWMRRRMRQNKRRFQFKPRAGFKREFKFK